MSTAVLARSLVLGYGGGPVILEVAKLDVEAGACVALIGPNGGGKSTLLKALTGRLPIRDGTLEVFGIPVAQRRSRVAYVSQAHEFDQQFPMTLSDLVAQGCLALRSWPRWRAAGEAALVKDALERLDLTELGDQPIGTLSGGQLQRALLARALVQDAKLLLLDEPLSAVDSQSRVVAWRFLERAQRQGATILLATHDQEDLERCDRVIGLKGLITSDTSRVFPAPSSAVAESG
jgi:ABC-type Mn2+/Zn2+ transport system ATPase subunit